MEAIKALIWLKPTSQGGRQSGITQGYRPHICAPNSSQGDPVLMGVWLTEVSRCDSSNWIEPGESGEVIFTLIYIDAYPETEVLYRYLQPGREFEIREGAKTIVGTGCIQDRFSD